MSAHQGPKRIGIGPYWVRYGASFAITIVSIIVAVFSFIASSFGMLFLAGLAIIGSGIYLRVIEMQRCRDIGWDPMLPLYFFGAGFLLSFLTFISGPLAVLTSALGLVVAMADFAGSIVIGCLPSKGAIPDHDVRTVAYTSYGAPSDYHERPESEADREARHEDAIARALQNYRSGGAPDPPAANPGPPPRVAGFGRKGVGGQPA
jgi:hypothetical protein